MKKRILIALLCGVMGISAVVGLAGCNSSSSTTSSAVSSKAASSAVSSSASSAASSSKAASSEASSAASSKAASETSSATSSSASSAVSKTWKASDLWGSWTGTRDDIGYSLTIYFGEDGTAYNTDRTLNFTYTVAADGTVTTEPIAVLDNTSGINIQSIQMNADGTMTFHARISGGNATLTMKKN